jgi:hypothetical protein
MFRSSNMVIKPTVTSQLNSNRYAISSSSLTPHVESTFPSGRSSTNSPCWKTSHHSPHPWGYLRCKPDLDK